MKDISKTKKGSLLIEALLSIVIISTSITLIIQAMTASLRSMVFSTEYTEAVLMLDNEMFRIISKGQVSSGVSDEYVDDSEEKYKYVLESDVWEDEILSSDSGNNRLNEAKIVVSWKRGAKENNVSFNAILFGEQ